MKTTLQRFKYHRYSYLMLAPALVYLILFRYVPIGGIVVAFQDFSPFLGFLKSPWVGLENFRSFFTDPFLGRSFVNTLRINLFGLLIVFPVPILLALLLNEVRFKSVQKSVQFITYMPYFLSEVVVVGLFLNFVEPDGIVNQLIESVGGESIYFMSESGWFIPIYMSTVVWQSTGFNMIIYLATLSAIDPTLYEVAEIDGAGRFARMFRITVPMILPTIAILFVLRVGQLVDAEFGRVLIMYNPLVYDRADVIDTYVYRKGLLSGNYSYGTAMGLLKGVIGLVLLFITNRFTRKMADTSVW